MSNLEECIDLALDFCSKLATAWDLSDYKGKQDLQFLMFPEGIWYDRKSEGCRTGKVNSFFSWIASQEGLSGGNKNGNDQCKLKVPALVPPRGTLSNQIIEILKNLACK